MFSLFIQLKELFSLEPSTVMKAGRRVGRRKQQHVLILSSLRLILILIIIILSPVTGIMILGGLSFKVGLFDIAEP